MAGKAAPHPPEQFIGDKGADRNWYEARFGNPAKLAPEERAALAALAAARQGGKQLLEDQTLASAGVKAGDVLRLQPEITAG